VRTRSSREFGSPEESVTPLKMNRLRKAAARYAQGREDLPASQRIDFIAVELDGRNRVKRIELIENAVDGAP
jgi:putative endonuclease